MRGLVRGLRRSTQIVPGSGGGPGLDRRRGRRHSRAMTLTLELPPEVEARVRRIPDLQERVITFVRGLAGEMEPPPPSGAVRFPSNAQELEEWRKARYSERARRISEQSRVEAEKMQREGFDREAEFDRLEVVLERISEKL